jgi:hypothetical protein
MRCRPWPLPVSLPTRQRQRKSSYPNKKGAAHHAAPFWLFRLKLRTRSAMRSRLTCAADAPRSSKGLRVPAHIVEHGEDPVRSVARGLFSRGSPSRIESMSEASSSITNGEMSGSVPSAARPRVEL